MKTNIFCLPAFEDNYIWCLHRNHSLVVVDPGDAAPVLNYLTSGNNRLAAILVTHHHRDHTGGVLELAQRFQVPVYAPATEHIAGTSHALSGGEKITIPELALELQVLDVAGHTRGHLAYYAAPVAADESGGEPGYLFCGDTVFGCGCGRLFEGTAAQLHQALTRIAALPPDTLIYSAHEYTESGIRFALTVEPNNPATVVRGDAVARLRREGQPTVPFTLEQEKQTSPFFRCGQEAVIQAVRQRYGASAGRHALAVFTALRQWRDEF